jgi:hypothetical protein
MMLFRLRVIVWILISFHSCCLAQADSARAKPMAIKFSGSADFFYTYDFSTPGGNYRQDFLYSYNRHNTLGLNHVFGKLSVEQEKYRANVALHAGTYVIDNYDEPEIIRPIYEANAGMALNASRTVWIDAGIFASHIGFESVAVFENSTLTRSLVAEGSPYYLMGAKFSYQPADNLYLAALVCNGWQRVKRVRGNSLPGFGTQVTFNPTHGLNLNWSTFAGTDDPDTERRMRYFNNLYANVSLTEKLEFTVGFDAGFQQTAKGSNTYYSWYGTVFIVTGRLNDYWAAAIRGEYYCDNNGIIVPTKTLLPFTTAGFSANIDFSPLRYLLFRMEARYFNSRFPVLRYEDAASTDNFFITGSLALAF